MTLPGIHATINTLPLGQPAPARGSDALFASGWTPWGPVETPTLVTSYQEFVDRFGPYNPNSELAAGISLFFRNGGRRAWISRSSHSDFAVATKNLKDQSADAGLNTIRVDAKYPSSTVDIKVAVSAMDEDEVTVTLTFSSVKLNRVETFPHFKLTLSSDEQAAVAAGQSPLNTIETVNNASKLVALTNLSSVTTAPDNVPRELAATALTGGVDTIGSVIDTDYTRAIAAFESEDLGPGQIAVFGFPDSTTRDDLIAHAEAFKRIALLDHTEDSPTEAITLRADLDSSYAAIYYPPQVQVPDLAGSGLPKTYAAIGAIAGIFAQVEFDTGVHRAPANYRLNNVISLLPDVYGQMTDGVRETLNEAQINAIAYFPGQGIKVYGARALKSYGRITAIHEQRVLNEIYYRLKPSLQEFVFKPANPALFREIASVCNQYLRELYRSGALYSPSGDEADAYRVICDATNNPPEQLAENQVTVDVGVHVVGMAEMIFLNINSVPLGSGLDVIVP